MADEELSLYDALCRMKEEMPGQAIPRLSTCYKHINAGDVGVRHGETPYHPSRKPKGPKPHPAMTLPGRLTLNDRLQLAFPRKCNCREEVFEFWLVELGNYGIMNYGITE